MVIVVASALGTDDDSLCQIEGIYSRDVVVGPGRTRVSRPVVTVGDVLSDQNTWITTSTSRPSPFGGFLLLGGVVVIIQPRRP